MALPPGPWAGEGAGYPGRMPRNAQPESSFTTLVVDASEGGDPFARALALHAFDVLCRPLDEPLGAGPGLPVWGPVRAEDAGPWVARASVILVCGAEGSTAAWVDTLDSRSASRVRRVSTLPSRISLALALIEADGGVAARVVASRPSSLTAGLRRVISESGQVHEVPSEADLAFVIHDNDCLRDGRFNAERHEIAAQSIPVVSAVASHRGVWHGLLDEGVERAQGHALAPEDLLAAGILEWARLQRFHRTATRLIEDTGLPWTTPVLPYAPRLADVLEVPRHHGRPTVLLHPDPELSVVDREILRRSRPRVVAMTPRTLFRRDAARLRRSVDAALVDVTVALSLSDSVGAGAAQPIMDAHVVDASLAVARTLLASSAGVAYAGDLRPGGYTEHLAALHRDYDRVRGDGETRLVLIRPDHPCFPDPVDALEAVVERVAIPGIAAGSGVLDAGGQAAAQSAVRRWAAQQGYPRVLISGNLTPAPAEGGYLGPLPGVVEEAWRSLQYGAPLYVLGGFGGAAAAVAALLYGEGVDLALDDARWKDVPGYSERQSGLWRACSELDLPVSLKALSASIQELAAPHLESDALARAWNGLGLEDNRRLAHSTCIDDIAALVAKGILAWTASRAAVRKRVELVRARAMDAFDLDALAVADSAFLAPFGAAGEVDRATGGAVRRSLQRNGAPEPVPDPDLGFDFVVGLDLGDPRDAEASARAFGDSFQRMARGARNRGWSRLGLVLPSIADRDEREWVSIVTGALTEDVVIEWFEPDPERVRRLRRMLGADEDTVVTARFQAPAPSKKDYGDVVCSVRREGESLNIWYVPPEGTALGRARSVPFDSARRAQLSVGVADGGSTPSPAELLRRGRELASLLFGEEAEALVTERSRSRWTIAHDVGAACLPFELINARVVAAEGHERIPSEEGGLHRRLLLDEAPAARILAGPRPLSPLRVGLIVSSQGVDAGFREEAEILRDELERVAGLTIAMPGGFEASPTHFLDALRRCDLVHYIGHGFHYGDGRRGSGLMLEGGEFTAADLPDFSAYPGKGMRARVVFLNACQSGRAAGDGVRPESDATFAGSLLSAGVESFIGTQWKVRGSVALAFAQRFYGSLARGETVDESMRVARVEQRRRDLNGRVSEGWGNYMQYGDGRFRLIR